MTVDPESLCGDSAGVAVADPESTRSCGDPFIDLAVPESEGSLAKSDLAITITAVMHERGMTQTQLANLLGIDQPKVSRIMRGELKNFSLEQLMYFANRLNQDIEIVVRMKPASARRAARTFVTASPGRLRRRQAAAARA